MRQKPWVKVATVESESEPGKTYDIKCRRSDGHLGCGCMSYRFSSPVKTCKHLEAFGATDVKVPAGIDIKVTGSARVTMPSGETFTVERAITFDAWGA